MMKKKAQVWIETVVYTIVGLAIIGIVLGVVMPKINESKDNIVVEQSIEALKTLDQKILDVSKETGSRGIIDFKIKRGYLMIDGPADNITLVVDDLSSLYSEENVTIQDGNVQILSNKGQKKNLVRLTLSYGLNITYLGKDEQKKLTSAPLAYRLLIENKNSGQI